MYNILTFLLMLIWIQPFWGQLYSKQLANDDRARMSKEKAFRYYKISAGKGKINAQFNHCAMLYNGEAIEMNKEEASI